MNNMVNLAANYGWGPHTLLYIFIITVAIGTVGLLMVMATTRMRPQPFASKKRSHFERYWAIGIAGVPVWLWIISYPWMPPVAFSSINPTQKNLQIVANAPGSVFVAATTTTTNAIQSAGQVSQSELKFIVTRARYDDLRHAMNESENLIYLIFDKSGTFMHTRSVIFDSRSDGRL